LQEQVVAEEKEEGLVEAEKEGLQDSLDHSGVLGGALHPLSGMEGYGRSSIGM
jgi:hypothetical protein